MKKYLFLFLAFLLSICAQSAFAVDKEGIIYIPHHPGHLFHVTNDGYINDPVGYFRLDYKPNYTDSDNKICTNSTVAYDRSSYNTRWYCTTDYVLTQRIFDFSAGISLPIVINGRLFTDVITDATYGSDLNKPPYGWKHLNLWFYNRADNPNVATSAVLRHSNYTYPQDQRYATINNAQGMYCINRSKVYATDNSLANCETNGYGQASVSIENVGILNAKSSQDMYYNGSLYFAANIASGFSSLRQLTVTVDPLAGGIITNFPDCLTRPNNAGNVWQGNCAGDVTLKSLANPGWGLFQWDDGIANYYNDNLTVGMDADKNVLATLSPMVSLSIHINPLEGGEVTGEDISCNVNTSSICEYDVVKNESVTLTATPKSCDYVFSHWKIGTEQFTDNPLTLTMEATKVVEAVFVPSLKWPLNGLKSDRTILLGFGDDWLNSCGGQVKKHSGIDIDAVVNEAVKAAEAGIIKFIFEDTSEYHWGWCIVIEHNGSYTTTYWHLNDPRNAETYTGAAVVKGQDIGTVKDLLDNTHLHFGVRIHPYTSDNIPNAGALPQTPNCNGYPAYPELFVDPQTIIYE